VGRIQFASDEQSFPPSKMKNVRTSAANPKWLRDIGLDCAEWKPVRH
jgi:hypothetical protein